MKPVIQIGTRDSELAIWQATLVKDFLADSGYSSQLVFIKSDGDGDLQTPLYDLGVEGIFTRSLDLALLNKHIDIAVHSLKDVPTRLPGGIVKAAVLKRGNHKDLLVFNNNPAMENDGKFRSLLDEPDPLSFDHSPFTIGTGSVRRKAQWLHKYPSHAIDNLRGNVNTRLRKLYESNWAGAIFAAAGLAAFLIALFTVSFQSAKAAFSNPVKSLRTE